MHEKEYRDIWDNKWDRLKINLFNGLFFLGKEWINISVHRKANYWTFGDWR